jgi:hypothetical protein
VTTQLADGTFYDTTQRPLPSVTAFPGSALVDFWGLPVHINHDAYGQRNLDYNPQASNFGQATAANLPAQGEDPTMGLPWPSLYHPYPGHSAASRFPPVPLHMVLHSHRPPSDTQGVSQVAKSLGTSK